MAEIQHFTTLKIRGPKIFVQDAHKRKTQIRWVRAGPGLSICEGQISFKGNMVLIGTERKRDITLSLQYITLVARADRQTMRETRIHTHSGSL